MALRDAIYIRRALSSAWGWRCFESRMKDWTCRGATYKRGSPITGRKYKSERRNMVRRKFDESGQRCRRIKGTTKGNQMCWRRFERPQNEQFFKKGMCLRVRTRSEENTNLWTLVYSAASSFHGSPFAFLLIRSIVSPDPSHIYLSRETCVVTIYFLGLLRQNIL